MLSSSTQHKQIYFLNFAQLKDLPPLMQLKLKEKNYRNWHPINQILPLGIEIFGYLHKHANVFLHLC